MTSPNGNAEEVEKLRARIAELEYVLAERRRESTVGMPSQHGAMIGAEQLRAIFDNYSGGMAFSRDGIMIDANPGLARMLGITVEELIGKPIVQFIAVGDRELVREHIERGYTKPYEHRLQRQDGTTVPVEATASVIQANGISYRFSVIRDISARIEAEEKVKSEQDFLRMLIKAHERDRQLMAYEIHDGLVQYITAAVWHLDTVVANAKLDPESYATLTKSQSLLRQSINDARRVLSGLRPPVLDEQGVVVAIDYLVAENSIPGELEIEVQRDVHFRRLEPLLEGAIFRIVQESLNNVRKYSGATKATVHLHQKNDRLLLSIEDNGRGFRVNAVPRDRFGLQGIRKRAELLGGSATIESTIGKGTKVTADLPLLAFQEDFSE
jgi:PAS domain S-box-containing protein